MSQALAAGAWGAALLAGSLAALTWRGMARRMEVVARACHELRGPITAARLGLELGIGQGELSPARLRAIDLELRRASLALEDLAQGDGIKGGPRRLGEVDVAELLADLVEAWQASAEAHGVELRLCWSGGAVRVAGDRLRLAQAIANLIANAIEHGGGLVEVRGRGDPDGARIEVKDCGPGLPAPVAQLVRGARGGRGARGRGLAIASVIAHDHGGRLAGAPSDLGARLTLELPSRLGHSSSAPATNGHRPRA